MYQADIDALQRLFELKSQGVITVAEYERKKIQILSAETSTRTSGPHSESRLGQGVSLLVGAIILLLVTVSILSDDLPSKNDLQEALGFISLFGLWLIPHSIWLLTKRGSNTVLPIISLALTGVCALDYAVSV